MYKSGLMELEAVVATIARLGSFAVRRPSIWTRVADS